MRTRLAVSISCIALGMAGCASGNDEYARVQQQISENCQSIATANANQAVINTNNARAAAGTPTDNRLDYAIKGGILGALAGDPVTGAELGIKLAEATRAEPGSPLPPLTQYEANAVFNNVFQSRYASCMNQEMSKYQRYINQNRGFNNPNYRFNFRFN